MLFDGKLRVPFLTSKSEGKREEMSFSTRLETYPKREKTSEESLGIN